MSEPQAQTAARSGRCDHVSVNYRSLSRRLPSGAAALQTCFVLFLVLGFTALAQQGPTPSSIAAANAYGLPQPPFGGSVAGPFEIDQPNVLVYIDESRLRLTMLFTDSHSVLLADISADGATVAPRFAFNPSGYYVISGSRLSAPLYEPPAGLDEQWPMVVPIYQIVNQAAAQMAAAGRSTESAQLDALLSQIISGGNEARGQIISDGFAECIDHYVDGIYQGCW